MDNDKKFTDWTSKHRGWDLPHLPWVMKQTWNNLLFINYPVSIATMRAFVPEQLPIDTFDNQAWISIVPFKMDNVALRGIPISIDFPELNVRTYVMIDNKPGVFFFSLDASSLLTVLLANGTIKLPYYYADMTIDMDQNVTRFTSQRKKQLNNAFCCQYKPTSESFFAQQNTLEHWLTERYCFYLVTNSGKIKRGEILHKPWSLQQAKLSINMNTLSVMKQLNLEHTKPLLYYSKGVDVRVWPLTHV